MADKEIKIHIAATANAAAADLSSQVDYEAERARLEKVVELEQRRIDAAKEAEAKTAEYVKKATDEKNAAEAECRAVCERRHNADGTPKRGWMKAPNGKPTKLTERQWVQVRTPSFKRWFGDWERQATADAILGDGSMVARIVLCEDANYDGESTSIEDIRKIADPVTREPNTGRKSQSSHAPHSIAEFFGGINSRVKEAGVPFNYASGDTPIARSQSAEPLPKCFADLRSMAALNLRERSICSAVSTGGFQR